LVKLNTEFIITKLLINLQACVIFSTPFFVFTPLDYSAIPLAQRHCRNTYWHIYYLCAKIAFFNHTRRIVCTEKSYLCSMNKVAVENIGKVCLDLGKLSFASLVLGTILKGNIEKAYVIIAGSITALILIGIGIILITQSK
jgi:hypothetical protein